MDKKMTNRRCMKLKKQLELYIEEYDLSVTKLAKKSSVPKQTIHNWIAGQKPADVRQVKKVAEILNTSIDNLLFGDGIEKLSTPMNKSPLDLIFDDEWVSGVFEIKIRRVKK